VFDLYHLALIAAAISGSAGNTTSIESATVANKIAIRAINSVVKIQIKIQTGYEIRMSCVKFFQKVNAERRTDL